MCFHFSPHLQAWRSSAWPDGLSQWWRLPSSAILSVPQHPSSSGLAWGHQFVMGLVCVWLLVLIFLPLRILTMRTRGQGVVVLCDKLKEIPSRAEVTSQKERSCWSILTSPKGPEKWSFGSY